jgi:hypothetical protein
MDTQISTIKIRGRKMKSRILISLLTFFAAIFFTGTAAYSENWCWYECDVSKLGVGGTRYEFRLSGTKIGTSSSCVATINNWYEIHANSLQLKEEILTIMLTAVSLGKKVEVLVIPDTKKSIYAIYLQN